MSALSPRLLVGLCLAACALLPAACEGESSDPTDTLADTATDTATTDDDTGAPLDTTGDTATDTTPIDCVPSSCADEGLSCGRHSDHCGGLLSCGACTASDICGVGAAGRCAPTGGFRIPDTDTPFCVSTLFVGSGGACPRADEAWFGQDGNYRLNLPAYTTETLPDSGAPVLVDRVTGLRWAVGSIDDVEVAASEDSCAALDPDSKTWRVPTLFELLTVIDHGKKEFVYDPRLPIGLLDLVLLTDTTAADASRLALRTGNGEASTASQGAVLCVSGETPARQWSPAGTQTQFDESLNLQWTRDSRGPASWELALFLCEGLTLDGTDDWRMPTLTELSVLLVGGALDPVIDNAAIGEYWSATPDAANSSGLVSSSSIHTMDFAAGRPRTREPDAELHYLCVRSTQ